MPRSIAARSEAEALRQFLDPFQRAIAAFAENVVFLTGHPDPTTRTRVVTIANEDVVVFRDAHGERRVALGVELAIRAIRLPEQPRRWTVESTRYIYRLEEPTVPLRRIVGYHWHPEGTGIPFPHIHLYAAASAVQRLHVATPPSTIKDVLTTAMHEYNVAPRAPHRHDWATLLHAADEALQTSMHWALTVERSAR